MKIIYIFVIAYLIVSAIIIIFKHKQKFSKKYFEYFSLKPSPAFGRKIGKQKSYAIVIARYKEDINWVMDDYMLESIRIHSKNPIINLYIYLKHDHPLNFNINDLYKHYTNVYIERIKNVGMCDQTYLYHIIKNYNNFEDITYFIPGSSASKIKIDLLKNLMKNGHAYKYYFTRVRTEYALEIFRTIDYQVTDEKNRDSENTKFTLAKIRPFGKWYRYYIGKDFNHLETNHKGIFSLHRSLLKKYPLQFYRKINNLVNKNVNPEESHYLERAYHVLSI